MPLLSSLIQSLSAVFPHINILPCFTIYNTPYSSLTIILSVSSSQNFLSYSPQNLLTLPKQLVNQILDDYIQHYFKNFTLLFTHVSIGLTSVDYIYTLLNLLIQFSGNIPPVISSFTVKLYVIQEALICNKAIS